MSTAQDPGRLGGAEFPGSAGSLALFWHVARRGRELARPPVQAALWHQVRRGTLDFAALAAVLGALAGFLTIVTVDIGFGLGVTAGVRVFHSLVLRQLAGFACTLLLVAGPGTAALVELGLMRQQGELRTLRLIGIDPRDLLVLPRVLGFALALFVLVFVFQVSAAVGGFALAAAFGGASFTQEILTLADLLQPATLVVSGARNLLLGAILGLIVCHLGLVAPFAPARLPEAVNRLLARSLAALVVVQGGAALFLP
ncbi:MAG: ABC transporter permease [Verrucomicrobia bacterium]|nr:ABC transporter permease [Verrucomicrobiota bacterium]